MTKSSVSRVVGSGGGHYELGRLIGRGGQGAVHLCRSNPRIAVKLVSNPTRRQSEAMRQQLAAVRRMDLDGLPIARPVETLAPPHVGYVMELATGMCDLSSLIRPPRSEKSVRDWYVDTGGLKRRLRLIHRLASIFARLHGKGLAYGDPSPGNVLVSEDAATDQVLLIDCDNLRSSSNPNDLRLHTPSFGAPELISGGSGINSLTDAHAFAVIAFQVLNLCHPLVGDVVSLGDPEMEERAYRGDFPWIEHADKESNRCSGGIPRDFTLSPNLRKLFSATFETGMSDPTARPGMAHWSEVLRTAFGFVIGCPNCGWSYYHNLKACPLCDRPRPSRLIGLVVLWDPDLGDGGNLALGPNEKLRPFDGGVGTAGTKLEMSKRQLGLGESDETVLEGSIAGDKVTLVDPSKGDRLEVSSSPNARNRRRITGQPQSFRLSTSGSSLYVHAGDHNVMHRVLQITISRGVDG